MRKTNHRPQITDGRTDIRAVDSILEPGGPSGKFLKPWGPSGYFFLQLIGKLCFHIRIPRFPGGGHGPPGPPAIYTSVLEPFSDFLESEGSGAASIGL